MKLTTTNHKLQIVLAGAVTTNQLRCIVSYKIYTSTTTTDGQVEINTNNTTDVDLAGASTTGLTTALPATAAAPGTVTTSFWGCVS